MALLGVQTVFPFIKRKISWCLGVLFLALVIQCKPQVEEKIEEIPFYNSAEFTAEWIPKNSPNYKDIHQIAAFSFQNQLGETVTNDTFKGKIYVANFFFTSCPAICPKMTVNLKEVQEEFRNDPEVQILSHTVMPWVDTRPVLVEYAENQGVNGDKWHLLRGSKEAIYDLARNSYFAEKGIGLQKSADEFLHTENFLLIDGNGRIRGVFNGTLPLETERLIETIYSLKKEV